MARKTTAFAGVVEILGNESDGDLVGVGEALFGDWPPERFGVFTDRDSSDFRLFLVDLGVLV